MANKKRDEINKLHERLDEITFCVSEEQIDVEEIEKIEPIDMNSPEADPEKAFQRFKERYRLSDADFLKRT